MIKRSLDMIVSLVGLAVAWPLLVIERRIPERAEVGVSREAFMTDLEMLVMTPGGRERTESDFRAIFAAAGFRHVRTLQTATTLSVFEGQPL